MTEEIQEIERLIKQSAELGDSLIRLAQKLQEQNQKQARVYEERWENLHALNKTLTDLRSYIEVLRAGVDGKTITADATVDQLAKSLDLPASRRIQIRETVKAAFEAGDDVTSKIKPFLKDAGQQQTEHQQARKTIAMAP